MRSPTTEEIIQKWMARSDLTRDEVISAAVDMLNFICDAKDRGAQVALWERGGFRVYEIDAPGLTLPPTST
jgi:hypothetical protein